MGEEKTRVLQVEEEMSSPLPVRENLEFVGEQNFFFYNFYDPYSMINVMLI